MRVSNKVCYYCGQPATSTEHAPPRQLFRKFDNIVSVTVPACEKHNGNKSEDDEIIIKAMLISLEGVARHLTVEQLKAIAIAKPHFQQVKNQVGRSILSHDLPIQFQQQMAHIRDTTNLDVWLRELTAALVYKALGHFDLTIDWDASIVWKPSIIPSEEPASLSEDYIIDFELSAQEIKNSLSYLTWQDGWCRNNYPKQLYNFQVCFHKKPAQEQISNGSHVVMKHCFLEQYIYYVTFFVRWDTFRNLQASTQNKALCYN